MKSRDESLIKSRMRNSTECDPRFFYFFIHFERFLTIAQKLCFLVCCSLVWHETETSYFMLYIISSLERVYESSETNSVYFFVPPFSDLLSLFHTVHKQFSLLLVYKHFHSSRSVFHSLCS